MSCCWVLILSWAQSKGDVRKCIPQLKSQHLQLNAPHQDAHICGENHTPQRYLKEILGIFQGLGVAHQRWVPTRPYLYKWLTRGLTPNEFIQFLNVRSSLVSPKLMKTHYPSGLLEDVPFFFFLNDQSLSKETIIKTECKMKKLNSKTLMDLDEDCYSGFIYFLFTLSYF